MYRICRWWGSAMLLLGCRRFLLVCFSLGGQCTDFDRRLQVEHCSEAAERPWQRVQRAKSWEKRSFLVQLVQCTSCVTLVCIKQDTWTRWNLHLPNLRVSNSSTGKLTQVHWHLYTYSVDRGIPGVVELHLHFWLFLCAPQATRGAAQSCLQTQSFVIYRKHAYIFIYPTTCIIIVITTPTTTIYNNIYVYIYTHVHTNTWYIYIIYKHVYYVYVYIYIDTWYEMIPYKMIWYALVWDDMIWYDMPWSDTVWNDTIW